MAQGILAGKDKVAASADLSPAEQVALQEKHGDLHHAYSNIKAAMEPGAPAAPLKSALGIEKVATPKQIENAENTMKYAIKIGAPLGEITSKLTAEEKTALQGKYGTIAEAHTQLSGKELTAEEKKAQSTTAASELAFPSIPKEELAAFNAKYAGAATPTTKAGLVEKVAAYKAMTAKNDKITQANYAAKQAEYKAQQEAAIKAAAEANAKYMTELGISQQQATAFGALVKMKGGGAGDLVKKFSVYENEAKVYGYPISGFEAALIKDYSDGGYMQINEALRQGKWTPEQHVYAKVLNKALDGMPKYEGEVKRHASLSPEDQALYEPGKVVEERAFTSTSTSKDHAKGASTEYFITAIGKRGSSIKKLSHYSNENEVLFKARTFFHVDKVVDNPHNKQVWMTELDD